MKSKFPNALRAVVTGGASGLGRAFCLRLAERGARVVVADIDYDGAKETVALVEQAGGAGLALEVDVSKWDAVEELAVKAREWLGEVDLIVNNAGVGVRGSLEKISLEDWEWVFGINLWGVIYCCKAFLPAMKKNNRGYIINVASLAGLVSAPKMGPYNVTKAGVVSLSETLCTELAKTKIQISVVCPSFFRTNIMASGRGEQSEAVRAVVARLMDKSKVQAPDVAQASLNAVFAGELYVLPMTDARLLWRMNRFVPAFFQRRIATPKR